MNEVENNLEDAGELEWHFRMSSPDVSALKQAASKFEGEFVVHVQENVEVLDGGSGQTEQADPMLVLICHDDLSGEEVAALEGRFKMFGEQNGLKYDGCDSFESIDADELYGWLSADAAYWRLRHLTDCGLEEDAELPWTFFVRTPSLDVNSKVCSGLESIGIGDLDEFVEPDDEGLYSVCAFTLGRNNEAELRTMVEKVSSVIEPVGVLLEGIQFYTREQFEMVFLEGDEEE